MKIIEHKSSSYGPRTSVNAGRANLTIAFAVDYTTAGERLTHKAAGANYIAIGFDRDSVMAAREVWKACKARGENIILNIAGNGIYTLAKHGWTQEAVNKYIYEILSIVAKHWPIAMIVSGGQTGVDLAGGVVAQMLGIPCEMTFPKGFRQRHENGVDAEHTEVDIRSAVAYYVGVLSREVYNDDVPQ